MVPNAAQQVDATAKAELQRVCIPVGESEQRSHLAGSEKWPRAWRLIFTVGCSVALWAIVVVFIRLI